MKELETIYVVFKTHFDIGFTGLAEEIVSFYRNNMLSDVVETCEKTMNNKEGHRYVWTMSSWPLLQSLKGKNKGNISKAVDLIESGQLVWHKLPFTTHTEFCGVEEFIRGLYLASQLDIKYGKSTISAKMTDVPGHTWMLPSILYKAGVSFLHLGCNACSMPPDVPQLFYWEGPDGNRVLTFYSKGGYGTSITPPKDWNYPVWLALLQADDNNGPQSAQIVEEVLKEAEEKFPGTEVVIGTMDDFARDLLSYDLNVPVIKSDLADSWIHGIGTYPREVAKVRALRQDIFTVESLTTLNKLVKEGSEQDWEIYKEHIKKAYEMLLLFGEHTWGLDTKITLLPLHKGIRMYDKEGFLADKESDSYIRIEKSWREKASYVAKAEQEIESIDCCIGKLSDRDVYKLIRVFNPLGWKRNDMIRMNLDSDCDLSIIDTVTGEEYQMCKEDNRYVAKVHGIPPMGYKMFAVASKQTRQSGKNYSQIASKIESKALLENHRIRIVVDDYKGSIISLYDKSNLKEWVCQDDSIGFGEYIYDIYGKEDINRFLKDYAYDLADWYINDFGKPGYPWIESHTYIPMDYRIDVENGNGWGKIIVKGDMAQESYVEYGNARGMIMEITLYEDSNYIDIRYELLNKVETPLAESGHFAFPLSTSKASYAIQKMGSVVNPQEDIQYGANTVLYCCDRWVDVEDNGMGLAFIPLDTPLFSIGEKSIYKYSPDYSHKSSILYFNAFNNQWGTNFPQWMGGNYTFHYRIYPHKGGWKEGEVWRLAEEVTVPLHVSNEEKVVSNDVGINMISLFKKDLDGALITAFKPSERGEDYILRLQESMGKKGELNITFKQKLRKAILCDALENELIPLKFDEDDYNIKLDTNPFEIHTLKIGF